MAAGAHAVRALDHLDDLALSTVSTVAGAVSDTGDDAVRLVW